MNRARRVHLLEERATEEWLREEARARNVPLEDARQQRRLWDAQLKRYGIREGDLVSPETLDRFLREFSLAVAPEEDPETYVVSTLAEWERT
jgi:hypothetical protein